MGIFSKFEGKMEDTFEGAAGAMSNAPISPVQIFKKAEKQMRRNIMVGAGKEFAPTLYTVLINVDDDQRMFGYYPTLAGEAETYLENKAAQEGLIMDGHPLVRFVADEGLRHGKFEIIAETVAAPIVAQLRQEEMVRYGLAAPLPNGSQQDAYGADPRNASDGSEPAQPKRKPPLPYVPEEEIDRSIDYGEYTFNSEDFEDYSKRASQQVYDDNAPESYETYGEQPEEYDGYGDDYKEPVAYGEAEEYAAESHIYEQQLQSLPRDFWKQQEPEPQPQAYQPQPQPQAYQPQPNTVVYASNQPTAVAVPPVVQSTRARIINVAYRRAYDLAGSHITIGRESSNDITVQDINASRRHAELNLTAQGVWTITDLGSTNGTIVNGMRIATQPLRAGDIITIGKTDLEFTLL